VETLPHRLDADFFVCDLLHAAREFPLRRVGDEHQGYGKMYTLFMPPLQAESERLEVLQQGNRAKEWVTLG